MAQIDASKLLFSIPATEIVKRPRRTEERSQPFDNHLRQAEKQPQDADSSAVTPDARPQTGAAGNRPPAPDKNDQASQASQVSEKPKQTTGGDQKADNAADANNAVDHKDNSKPDEKTQSNDPGSQPPPLNATNASVVPGPPITDQQAKTADSAHDLTADPQAATGKHVTTLAIAAQQVATPPKQTTAAVPRETKAQIAAKSQTIQVPEQANVTDHTTQVVATANAATATKAADKAQVAVQVIEVAQQPTLASTKGPVPATAPNGSPRSFGNNGILTKRVPSSRKPRRKRQVMLSRPLTRSHRVPRRPTPHRRRRLRFRWPYRALPARRLLLLLLYPLRLLIRQVRKR